MQSCLTSLLTPTWLTIRDEVGMVNLTLKKDYREKDTETSHFGL